MGREESHLSSLKGGRKVLIKMQRFSVRYTYDRFSCLDLIESGLNRLLNFDGFSLNWWPLASRFQLRRLVN
jgi:hypothetical protein